MSQEPPLPSALSNLTPEKLRRHGKSAFRGGVISILLGLGAIALPGLFTLGIEIFIGTLLLIAGLSQIFSAIGSTGSKNWWLALLSGILTALVGGLFLLNPLKGVVALTVILGIFFLVSGIFRLFYSAQLKATPGAGWGTINAVISIILGVLVLTGIPEASTFILGLFLGIDLLFFGFFLLVFGSACRNAADSPNQTIEQD
jgi:uncharacterized membrane protein HdeD (DUF308 family)